jgi:hypothetical protein
MPKAFVQPAMVKDSLKFWRGMGKRIAIISPSTRKVVRFVD